MFFVLTMGGYSTVHGVTPGRISFCSLEGFSSDQEEMITAAHTEERRGVV